MVLFGVIFIGIAIVTIAITICLQYLDILEKINPENKWSPKNLNYFAIPLVIILLVLGVNILVLVLDDRSMGGSFDKISKDMKTMISDAKDSRKGLTVDKLNASLIGDATHDIIQMSRAMKLLFFDAYGVTELENANQLVQKELSDIWDKFKNLNDWLDVVKAMGLPPNCDLTDLYSSAIFWQLQAMWNQSTVISKQLENLKPNADPIYNQSISVEGTKQLGGVKKYFETAFPDTGKMFDQFESDMNALNTATRQKWFKELNTKTPAFGTGNNFKILICLSCAVLLLNAIYSIFCTCFVNHATEELTNSIYVSELVTFANCLCLIGASVVDLIGLFKCDVNGQLRVSNFTTPYASSMGSSLETCAAGQKTFFESLASVGALYKSLKVEETFNKLSELVEWPKITESVSGHNPDVLHNIKNGINHMNTLLKNRCLNRLKTNELLEYRDKLAKLMKIHEIYHPYIDNYNEIVRNGSSISSRIIYWFYAKRLPAAEEQINEVANQMIAGDMPCDTIVASFSNSRYLVCLPFEAPFEVFWIYIIVAVVAGVISLIINKMIFKSLPDVIAQKAKDVEAELEKGRNPTVAPTAPGNGKAPAPTVAPTTNTPNKGMNLVPTTSPAPKAAPPTMTIPNKGKNPAPTVAPTTPPAPPTAPTPTAPGMGKAPTTTIPNKGKNPAPAAAPTKAPAKLTTPTPTTPNKGKQPAQLTPKKTK